MLQAKRLSSFELGKIEAFHQQGLRQTEIADRVGCHKSSVSRYLHSDRRFGIPPEPREPIKKITPREERKIINLASTGHYSIREIARDPAITVSKSTVQRVLSNCDHLQYSKRKVQPPLTPFHKKQRLEFARNHMTWDEDDWKVVVFSDEKKFNLDGPDGRSHYWHDLRREPEILSRRQFGGGSVMTWGAFGYNGKAELGIVPPRMNSEGYQRILESNLIRQGPSLGGDFWIFQQDNASVHASRSTRNFLEAHNVDTLNWPARSPDLNPMENLWGEVSRRVYANGKQYESRDSLKEGILQTWDEIPESTLQNLILSMPRRIFKVIQSGGGFIGYIVLITFLIIAFFG